MFARHYVSQPHRGLLADRLMQTPSALRLPRIYFVHSLAALVLFRQGRHPAYARKDTPKAYITAMALFQIQAKKCEIYNFALLVVYPALRAVLK